jgi:5-methylcytosine-specific restriction enzyme subunit McrC
MTHFVYLLARCSIFPHVAEGVAEVQTDATLWEVVAAWYVNALERVLRIGLLSDYQEVSDELQMVRGIVRPMESATRYYSGSTALVCDYEEYDVDSPLNRVLRAAALQVARAPLEDDLLRRRARRALARLDHVGELRVGDLDVQPDRGSWFYRDAHLLARRVLAGTGTVAAIGSQKGWTFLVRTPEPMEEAVRNILRVGLLGKISVEKRGRKLGESGLGLNPDLVFGSVAVGDVKYRVSAAKWERSDIYQLTTFATGYGVESAGLFTFSTSGPIGLPEVPVGPVRLCAFFWDASENTDPAASSEAVVAQAEWWLKATQLTAKAKG